MKKILIYGAALVFWPWVPILFELLLLWFFTANGCVISARGAEPCLIWGRDFGETASGLWTIGYQIALSLLYVVPAFVLWIVVIVVFQVNSTRSSQGQK